MTGRCALYLRSSKDRKDVSIDAQRRELLELARARGLEVAAEFSDVVVSGATENRPGWQDLLRELKAPARTWTKILALDTARIARNQWIAHGLRHECKKRGVDLVFAKTPELDGIAGVILPAVLHAMDEVHSMLSREKGLAGMAENVRRGHRAGGRAPLGYRLKRTATGAVRDGAPVTKSSLEPSDRAPAIAAFLKARAAGETRRAAARAAGLAKLSTSTLIGVEANARTYAGSTVWNGIVQAGTHDALISSSAADAILEQLERRKQTRAKGASYLLSGILVAPGGRRWHGDGEGFYRLGSRRVKAETLERAVLEKVAGDLTSAEFIKRCLERSRELVRPQRRDAELRALQRQIRELELKAGRIRNAISEMKHPQGMIAMLDKIEAERFELERQAAAVAETASAERVLLMITEQDVRAVLAGVVDCLDAAGDRDEVKSRIRQLLEQITLEPERLTCQLHYAIPAVTGDKMASPREADLIPGNSAVLRALERLTLLSGSRRRLPRAA